MQNVDTPKIWNEDDIKYDPETGEILEDYDAPTDIVPVEEVAVPSIAEQKEIVNNSDVSEEGKSLLGSLIEMNNIANTLTLLRNNETIEQRKTVVTAMCEAFINERMRNNIVAEDLKRKLLERLLVNVDNLDLQTTAQIYNDLHDTSSVDSQQAMTNLNGGNPTMPGQGGTTFNLNLATGENSMVTANTLNAQPQQVQQLKEVAALNSSIRAWQNIPGKKPIQQAQIVDNTQK